MREGVYVLPVVPLSVNIIQYVSFGQVWLKFWASPPHLIS